MPKKEWKKKRGSSNQFGLAKSCVKRSINCLNKPDYHKLCKKTKYSIENILLKENKKLKQGTLVASATFNSNEKNQINIIVNKRERELTKLHKVTNMNVIRQANQQQQHTTPSVRHRQMNYMSARTPMSAIKRSDDNLAKSGHVLKAKQRLPFGFNTPKARIQPTASNKYISKTVGPISRIKQTNATPNTFNSYSQTKTSNINIQYKAIDPCKIVSKTVENNGRIKSVRRSIRILNKLSPTGTPSSSFLDLKKSLFPKSASKIPIFRGVARDFSKTDVVQRTRAARKSILKITNGADSKLQNLSINEDSCVVLSSKFLRELLNAAKHDKPISSLSDSQHSIKFMDKSSLLKFVLNEKEETSLKEEKIICEEKSSEIITEEIVSNELSNTKKIEKNNEQVKTEENIYQNETNPKDDQNQIKENSILIQIKNDANECDEFTLKKENLNVNTIECCKEIKEKQSPNKIIKNKTDDEQEIELVEVCVYSVCTSTDDLENDYNETKFSKEKEEIEKENQNQEANEYSVVENHLIECQDKHDAADPNTEPLNKNDEVDPKTDKVNLKTDEVNPKTDEVDSKTDEVNSKTDEVNPKTDEVNSKTDEVNSKTDEVNSKTDEVDSKTDEVNSKTDEVDSKTDEVDSKTDEVNSKTDEVNSKTDEVDSKIETLYKDESTDSKNDEEKVTNKKRKYTRKPKVNNNVLANTLNEVLSETNSTTPVKELKSKRTYTKKNQIKPTNAVADENEAPQETRVLTRAQRARLNP